MKGWRMAAAWSRSASRASAEKEDSGIAHPATDRPQRQEGGEAGVGHLGAEVQERRREPLPTEVRPQSIGMRASQGPKRAEGRPEAGAAQ